MIEELLDDAKRRMDKSVEATAHEFNTVRTGRASAALLDRVKVDYYGQETPLNQLATINVPEPRMLTDPAVRPELDQGDRAGDLRSPTSASRRRTTARSSACRSRSSRRSGARSSSRSSATSPRKGGSRCATSAGTACTT